MVVQANIRDKQGYTGPVVDGLFKRQLEKGVGVNMPISVRVLGDLRRFISAETTELEGDGWSVGRAVDEIIRRNPALRDAMFDFQGRMQHAIVLRTAGRPATWPADKETLIEDGGQLLLTRFHSGG